MEWCRVMVIWHQTLMAKAHCCHNANIIFRSYNKILSSEDSLGRLDGSRVSVRGTELAIIKCCEEAWLISVLYSMVNSVRVSEND